MENFRKVRKVLDQNRAMAKSQEEYDVFNVDRREAHKYFATHPKMLRTIREYFHTLKEENKKIVYADICGRATGDSLGADYSYSFSLNPGKYLESDNSRTFFKGDIFNKGDFLRFVNTIKGHGDKLNLVTFEPLAGLMGYDWPKDKENTDFHKAVVNKQLENNLKMIVDILEPGGYIYMSKPFSLGGVDTLDFLMRKKQNEYQRSKEMKIFCRKNGLRIKIEGTIFGPVFLIHKPIRKEKVVT